MFNKCDTELQLANVCWWAIGDYRDANSSPGCSKAGQSRKTLSSGRHAGPPVGLNSLIFFSLKYLLNAQIKTSV